MVSEALQRYRARRDFSVTSEPAEGGRANEAARAFVVQKHWATRLHYDFRLELDGTMKSWAVPKGPSFDPHDRRMAVHVEDHPIAYNRFEGTIPPKQYGAGKVIIWDKGVWLPQGDPREGYRDGNLKFELRGLKLHGRWVLVRMKDQRGRQDTWLLIKEKDAWVRPAAEFSVVDEMPDSVKDLPAPDASALPPAPDPPGNAAAQAGPAEPAGPAEQAEQAEAARPAKRAKSVKPARPTRASASSEWVPDAAAAALPPLPAAARRSALPANLQPQLATLVDAAPKDAQNWLYEAKFDGYRMLMRIDRSLRLYTRNGHDWTERMPALAEEAARLQLPAGWYDGEIVVLGAAGIPDFQALQGVFETACGGDIVYYLFDVPFLDGYDLRQAPLEQRRAVLQALLASRASPRLRFSQVFDAPAEEIVASACRLGLEGVVGKRRDSAYVSRRSPDWIKLKCSQRQEFVIGGWTDPKGSRTGIGSLLLGVHDDAGALQYAGNVGTGFDERSLHELREQLDAIPASRSPFAGATGAGRDVHWVEPRLVAEVSFGEWTRTGRIRHSVFHGLRRDKPAASIVHEQPAQLEGEAPKARAQRGAAKKPSAANPSSSVTEPASTLPPSFRISNPERLIDPKSGARKIDLVRYYGLVAPLLLPQLQGRPVSLVRAPDGITGQLFFQKHAGADKLAGVRELDPALFPGHPALIEITGLEGLLAAAQRNVVELHTVNAKADAFETPDRMVFDLDPGEGVAWKEMQQAAELVHVLLDEIGLVPFLKTSGGKGLHVVVPLRQEAGWDAVKGFSQAVVQHLAATIPQRFVAKSGPANRVGKVFVDYLRNSVAATTVAAWSARARPGLGISVPVAWSELASLAGGAQWSVLDVHRRLDRGNEPWQAYERSARTLDKAMQRLGYEP